jgi:chromosome segregation ATPase
MSGQCPPVFIHMSNKDKRDSPLIKSVLALDSYLAELERIGARINSTDMTSDFDVEHVQKLMTRFAESGQSISEEVSELSRRLQEAQARTEAVTLGVSRQAELFNIRRNEQNEKLEEFRSLAGKVRELNALISQFRRPHGEGLTDDDRVRLTANIAGFETQLSVLIDELDNLRKSARDSRMKTLEKDAESLAQMLQAVRQKLPDLISLAAGRNGAPN